MFRHSFQPIRILVVMLLLPLVFGQASGNPKCDLEPPNYRSLIEEFQSRIWHDSMYNLPGLDSGFPVGPDDIDKSFVHIERTPHTLTECPLKPNDTNPELNARSTCTVRWSFNTDRNRFPVHVAEVECSCENCLEFDPEGRQTQNVCEPVYYYINALRRVGCLGEYYQYARVNEKIQIACACAHPYVKASERSSTNGPLPSY